MDDGAIGVVPNRERIFFLRSVLTTTVSCVVSCAIGSRMSSFRVKRLRYAEFYSHPLSAKVNESVSSCVHMVWFVIRISVFHWCEVLCHWYRLVCRWCRLVSHWCVMVWTDVTGVDRCVSVNWCHWCRLVYHWCRLMSLCRLVCHWCRVVC